MLTLKQYTVAAINSQNATQLAIATHNEYNQLVIEHLAENITTENIKQQLKQLPVALLSYVVTGIDALVDVIPSTNAKTFPGHCANLGISTNNHSDYFNFVDSAIIASLSHSASQEISTGLKNLTNSNFIISSEEIAITNLYLRIYPNVDTTKCASIVVGDEHISLVSLDSNTVVQVGHFRHSGNIADTITQLLRDSLSSITTPNFNYQLLLLAGQVDVELVNQVRTDCRPFLGNNFSVELFNPLFGNFINIEKLSHQQQLLLETEGYRFVTVLATTFSIMEYSGVDLSTSQSPLSKKFSSQLVFYTPQDISTRFLSTAINVTEKVGTAVATENRVVLIALVLSLGFSSYRYFSNNSTINSLQAETSTEQTKLDELKDVKQKFTLFQAKLKVKNDRINTIQEVQQQQLTIPTILRFIQDSQSSMGELLQVESLEINGNGKTVNLTGKSIDKAQTVELFRKISNNGYFLDVNPTYTDDLTQPLLCRFSVNTSYNGPVRMNAFELPIGTVEPIHANESAGSTNSAQSTTNDSNKPKIINVNSSQ